MLQVHRIRGERANGAIGHYLKRFGFISLIIYTLFVFRLLFSAHACTRRQRETHTLLTNMIRVFKTVSLYHIMLLLCCIVVVFFFNLVCFDLV